MESLDIIEADNDVTNNDVTSTPRHQPLIDQENKEGTTEADEITSDLKDGRGRPKLIYGIEDELPLSTLIGLSTQLFLTVFGGIYAAPLILSSFVCLDADKVALSEVVGTTFFVAGIITLLQTTFGSRLPIIQGGSASYLIPAIVMMGLKGECPPPLTANSTTIDHDIVTEAWQSRMRELQGTVSLAALTQFSIGFFGICGILMRFIGPITVAATITVLAITLFPLVGDMCATNWPIATIAAIQVILYSQVLDRLRIPCPGGRRISVFRYLPIFLSIMITWGLCGVLTAAGILSDIEGTPGYNARTDIYTDTVKQATWFRIPYPGQWGTPTVTAAGYIGMCAGALTSIIESIGDYYACARICDLPPPPSHAINRGIGMEGLGCIVAGLLGVGIGYTSYGDSISIIGITKIASRRVAQLAGVLLMLVGVFGKANAVFTTIPTPVIGGVLFATISFLASIGLCNLQFTDMNSSRNMLVLGISLIVGITIPNHVNSSGDIFDTGSVVVDQLLYVGLGTGMFLAGVTACLLDNLIPGTDEERGIKKWHVSTEETAGDEDKLRCYDLPFGMSYVRKWKWTRLLPFSPTFQGFRHSRRSFRRLRQK